MIDVAIIFGIAAILGVFAKLLKQPLILAYLFTGVVIGYFGLLSLNDQENIQFFSSIGVTLLLFLVGLEMEYTALKKVGKVSIAIGLGQVIFTFVFGYLIALFVFGLSTIHAAYLAIALTFSSTVIIVKLLSDKNAINSLYGRISVGLLLVQDFVVVILLVLLTGIQAGDGVSFFPVLFIILQGLVLFAIMLYLGRRILPFIFDRISRSYELIFLFSLAWVFFLAAGMKEIGFSIELAGFLGGIALANSSQKHQIACRIRPLRDFFILLFFAMLGSLMIVSNFSGIIVPILFFSAFVLIGNPFIVFLIMNVMGYKKRTSFLTGLTVAQISEFSLVLAMMGLTLGHITENIFAIISAVGVITITISTYLILYADKIFNYISPFIPTIRKVEMDEDKIAIEEDSKEIILIGGHRTGKGVLSSLPQDRVLVVDFDTIMVDELKKKGVASIFADINDPHLFERINLSQTKTIISTSPNMEDNLFLLKTLKDYDVSIILRAEFEDDAIELYEKGADYVLLPNFSSGQFIGKIVDLSKGSMELEKIKEEDIRVLKSLL